MKWKSDTAWEMDRGTKAQNTSFQIRNYKYRNVLITIQRLLSDAHNFGTDHGLQVKHDAANRGEGVELS